MKTADPFDAKKCASNLYQFLQDAMGDIASGMLEFPDLDNDKWSKKIKSAKKARVQDLHGWLADELYNDADTLQDLLGDRVWDESRGDKEKRVAILNELNGYGHKALKKAVSELLKNVRN